MIDLKSIKYLNLKLVNQKQKFYVYALLSETMKLTNFVENFET